MASRLYALVRGALVFLLALPIRFYRRAISPLLPAYCRYEPSCSRYALEALRVHGPLVGAGLAAYRICRCQPFGGRGYDPVPPARRRAEGRS